MMKRKKSKISSDIFKTDKNFINRKTDFTLVQNVSHFGHLTYFLSPIISEIPIMCNEKGMAVFMQSALQFFSTQCFLCLEQLQILLYTYWQLKIYT